MKYMYMYNNVILNINNSTPLETSGMVQIYQKLDHSIINKGIKRCQNHEEYNLVNPFLESVKTDFS